MRLLKPALQLNLIGVRIEIGRSYDRIGRKNGQPSRLAERDADHALGAMVDEKAGFVTAAFDPLQEFHTVFRVETHVRRQSVAMFCGVTDVDVFRRVAGLGIAQPVRGEVREIELPNFVEQGEEELEQGIDDTHCRIAPVDQRERPWPLARNLEAIDWRVAGLHGLDERQRLGHDQHGGAGLHQSHGICSHAAACHGERRRVQVY
jgi:hypothetical protein